MATFGQDVYITLAFFGVPSAQHGENIETGPHVGKMAT